MYLEDIVSYWPLLALLVVGIVLAFGSLFTVEQQHVAVVERFGKFLKLGHPGLNFKAPFIDSVARHVDLRINQLPVSVETKTKDNVFVTVKVAVQYHVLPEKVFDAHYRLGNHKAQIESYVFDLVRAELPKLTLDEVFERKDDVANAVKRELGEVMDDYGFAIVKALVADVDPDAKVKDSMNEINAAQRQRQAAEEKGEAARILLVKAAMAEAEAKKLQGKGIADQRRAIVDGLRDSVGEFQKGIPGSTAQDVMQMVLMTQYFDTLKDIGANTRTNTVFLDHTPGGLEDVRRMFAAAMQAKAPVEGDSNG